MVVGLDLVALLTFTALVAGTIDAMAGGGGLITIPTMIAAGLPPVSAIATNKLQSCCGTGSAALAFARAGHLDARRFALPTLASFLGAGAGAIVLQHVRPDFLAGLVPLLCIAIALYFLFGPRMTEVDRHARLGRAGLALLLAAVGFYDGFFGPGTGSFQITILVTLAGLGLVRAVAHTKLLNFASNVAGLGVLMVGGKVIWLLGLPMAVAAVAGNQVGARLAMRFGARAVRPLLVVMALALAGRLLFDPANPLRMTLGLGH